MLKRRIIPIQLLHDGRLVKPLQFGEWRDVGDPVKSSKVYSDQNADELIFLNISREHQGIKPLLRLIDEVSEVAFMPLAVGGGIRSYDDAARLIAEGADKVVVNSACYASPELISSIAQAYGNQAVVVGIDVRGNADSGWSCFSDASRQAEGICLDEHVERVVAAGAGEIMIQSIDRDGSREGYDCALIKHIVDTVDIPVIGAGGSNSYEDLREAFLGTDCSALACGSIFNFSDSNPIRAKAFLANYGIPCKVI